MSIQEKMDHALRLKDQGGVEYKVTHVSSQYQERQNKMLSSSLNCTQFEYKQAAHWNLAHDRFRKAIETFDVADTSNPTEVRVGTQFILALIIHVVCRQFV